MKKFLRLLGIAALMAAVFGFLACSDDGGSGNNQGGPQQDPVPDPVTGEILSELKAKKNKIFAEDFSGKTTLPVFTGFGCDAGVYVVDVESSSIKDSNDNAISNKNEYKGTVTDGNYSIADGVLTIGDGVKGGNNCAVIIDFGDELSTVEGYFELEIKDMQGNNINFFKDENNVALRLMLNDTLSCYLNYKNDGTCEGTVDGIALTTETKPAKPADFGVAKDTLYKIYYKFDFVNKKMTLKINETIVFNNVDTEIDSLSGVSINTSNGGGRQNKIKNIVVCGDLSTSAVALNEAKASAVEEIKAYDGSTSAGYDPTKITEEVNASIKKAQDDGEVAINAAKTESDIEVAVSNAKKAIDDIIKALNQSADDARTEHLPSLTTYAEEVKATFNALDTEISVTIDGIVTTQTAIINAKTTATEVIAAIADAKAAIDEKAAERRVTVYNIKYCDSDGTVLTGSAYENKTVTYDNAIVKPTDPKKDGVRFDKWVTSVGGSEEYDFTTKIYSATGTEISLYAKWKSPDATLTFTVGSNTKTISAYSHDKYGDYMLPVPVSTESGKKVSDWTPAIDLEAEIPAGTKEFTATVGGWKTNAELANTKYIVNSDTSATAGEKPSSVLVNTELVNIAMSDSAAVYAAVSANKPTATLADGTKVTGIEKAIRGANVAKKDDASGDSLTPLVVTAKEDVSVYLYLGLSASDYNGGRSGDICVGNTKVGSIESGKNTVGVATIKLSAGQTANVTIKNTGSSGGGWMFYGAEAVLADSFTNCSIVLNKKTGGNTTIPWTSLKIGADLVAKLATETDTDGDKAFVGWAKTTGASVADDLSGETVAAGDTLNLYSVFKESDVTINYYVPTLVENVLTQAITPIVVKAASGSPLAEATANAKLPAAGITGYNFKGWYTDSAMTTAYDFSTNLVAGDLNLYAKYAPKATAKVTFAKDGVFTITNSPTDAQLITLSKGTKFNTKEESKTIGGTTYTAYLKLESGTDFTLKAKSNITVTVYLSVASLTVGDTDITATAVTGESGIYSYSFPMDKDNVITVARKASGNLYYIEVAE